MANLRDLFTSILLISSQVFGQNLETKLIKGLSSNLNPGSINTIVFRILNQNDYSASLNVKLNAPASWRLFYNDSVTVQKNSVSITHSSEGATCHLTGILSNHFRIK